MGILWVPYIPSDTSFNSSPVLFRRCVERFGDRGSASLWDAISELILLPAMKRRGHDKIPPRLSDAGKRFTSYLMCTE